MIPIKQRIGDPNTGLHMAIDEAAKDMRVAMPAIIDSFDPETQTVECSIVIREKLIDKSTGEKENVEISKLVDVPIVHPRAGIYSITLPIKPGDECLVVFADMCYNSWWATGEIANQEEERRHDLSDAIAIIGIGSQTKLIENYNPDKLQIRNESGETYIEIDEEDINITSTANLNIECDNLVANAAEAAEITTPQLTVNSTTQHNGNMTVNGNLTVNGDLEVSANTRTAKLYIGGRDYDTHTHNYTWTDDGGSGTTGTPN